jgi:methanogenic corrinoid protein MtbC1
MVAFRHGTGSTGGYDDGDGRERFGGAEGGLALARTIETEIIPRLLLAHRTQSAVETASVSRVRRAHEVEQLTVLVLASDDRPALAYVDVLRARGATMESLCLDLLAPTAKHLGDLWVADIRTFADVTIGLCRLQQILHHLSIAFEHQVQPAESGRRILLAPAAGEQHTFGVLMLGEFFRRSGWDVWTHSAVHDAGLLDAVRSAWFDVVGISVSSDARLDMVRDTLTSVRRSSRNPSIGVMVGGRVFVDEPALVASVGADATAIDALDAVMQAEGLADLLAGH